MFDHTHVKALKDQSKPRCAVRLSVCCRQALHSPFQEYISISHSSDYSDCILGRCDGPFRQTGYLLLH